MSWPFVVVGVIAFAVILVRMQPWQARWIAASILGFAGAFMITMNWAAALMAQRSGRSYSWVPFSDVLLFSQPRWCPAVERSVARERAAADRERQKARMSFAAYAEDFIAWARVHHRSWRKDDSRLSRVLPVLRARKLDEITTGDIDRFLAGLLEGERPLAPASRNRYRDLLSGMFKRAMRLGLVNSNPVKMIPKLKESEAEWYACRRAARTALPMRKRHSCRSCPMSCAHCSRPRCTRGFAGPSRLACTGVTSTC
jgi:hypothetical protein